jgi:predicted pyridoxine 5'-phosphate oxidase superfamily flavin-nucleotide-binding protein
MDNYADHLFSEAARAHQEQASMRDRYEKVYATRLRDGLDADAKAFVETRKTFYMASIVDTGWPYVQHRGGPKGFLRVIDPHTIAFADYTGNKQFITTGNMDTDDRVSLILMDYPARARLKLIGHGKVIPASDEPDLTTQLHVDGEGPVERLFIIHLTAMDWNCPKYITPRFDEDEIAAQINPRFAEANRQINILAARLQALGEDPVALLNTKDIL